MTIGAIMKSGNRRGCSSARHEAGFNLIEVLVALLVLAVGLLGMAALQNFSMASTHQSYQRTQATIAIQDIADRMRANPSAAATGAYNIPAYTHTPPTYANNCSTGICTAAEMALYDMSTWVTYVTSNQVLGPTAQAQIVILGNVFDAGGTARGTTYLIGVRWVEGNDLNMSQTMTLELP